MSILSKVKKLLKTRKTVQLYPRLTENDGHFVKEGETLEDISMIFYGTPLRSKDILLENADSISNVDALYEGQYLKIPK